MGLRERLRETLSPATGDPLLWQLVRLFRVSRAIGVGAELPPLRPLEVVRLFLRQGASVRMVHTMYALLHPDWPALVDAQHIRTYAGADREIDRLANALAARFGLARGGAALLMTENRAEYVLAWFALLRLGARAVHASWRSTPRELEYLVEHSGARVILCSQPSLAAARAVHTARPEANLQLVVCDGPATAAGEIGYDELVKSGQARPPPRRASSGGNVVYTSGTTGRPKGAVRDFTAFGPREGARMLERLPMHIGERHLVVAPLYHSAPQAFVLLATTLGGTLYLLPHFSPEATLRALCEHAVESVFLVPTMLEQILDLPAHIHDRYPTPKLRAIVCGASEFPHPLRLRAIARFGAQRIFDFYGATEIGWVTLIRGDEMLSHRGSVGRALAGQRIHILGTDGRELPPGEVGLVYVENEQTMLEYLGDREASRAARRGAWITVDDLGRLDQDGYLYLVGRARDMVKSGGVNLYPAEIEAVLRRDPAIRDVAVIGVPDAKWGESLVAVVVPVAHPFDAAAAEARARRDLGGPKVPRRWEVVDELPRNANGKVLKTELRARFSAQPAA